MKYSALHELVVAAENPFSISYREGQCCWQRFARKWGHDVITSFAGVT